MTAHPTAEHRAPNGHAGTEADDAGFAAAALGRLRPMARDARRRTAEGAVSVRDWAVDQSDILRDTVQTKPFLTVGICAALAFAAGVALGGARARR